ncbi:MAG TPA: hypothetical protein VN457_03470 [Chlamydiales bacterium]|nr:hypothetical protein [Chlamydiales bacterium]
MKDENSYTAITALLLRVKLSLFHPLLKSGLFCLIACIMSAIVVAPMGLRGSDLQEQVGGQSLVHVPANVGFEKQALTAKIEKLEQRKKALQARADAAGRDAQRLLFIDWSGYRQQSRREDELRQQVKVLEAQIELLIQERNKLQKTVQ